jgi:hypothetical protein
MIVPIPMREAQSLERVAFWNLWSSKFREEVLHHHYAGSGSEQDPYVVSWLPSDLHNPMTFSLARKVTITCVAAFACFIVSFTSSAYAGSMTGIMDEFDIDREVATVGLSLFVFGFSVGPLIWAPMSESAGRQAPFLISSLALTVFSAGCAGAQNIETLLVLRFFGGAFGSSPLVIAGGVIADMFSARQRGLALLLFASAPYLGNISLCSNSHVAELFRANIFLRPLPWTNRRWLPRHEGRMEVGRGFLIRCRSTCMAPDAPACA